jgi:hypothetical protein
MITPYCSICQLPAERFTMDVVKSPYYVGLHVQCCDRTSSMRLPVEEVFRLRHTKEKLFVVMQKGRHQGIRALPSGDLSYERPK